MIGTVFKNMAISYYIKERVEIFGSRKLMSWLREKYFYSLSTNAEELYFLSHAVALYKFHYIKKEPTTR